MFWLIFSSHSFNIALNLFLFQALVAFWPEKGVIIFNSITENFCRLGSVILDLLMARDYRFLYSFLSFYVLSNFLSLSAFVFQSRTLFLLSWCLNRFFHSGGSIMKEYFSLSRRTDSLKIKGMSSLICVVVAYFISRNTEHMFSRIIVASLIICVLFSALINFKTAIALEGYTTDYRRKLKTTIVDTKTMITASLYLMFASMFIMFKPADHYLSLLIPYSSTPILRAIGMSASLLLCYSPSKYFAATTYHIVSIFVYLLCFFVKFLGYNSTILTFIICILWGFMSITKEFVLFSILPSYLGRYVVLIYHTVSMISSVFYNLQITQNLDSTLMYKIIIISHVLALFFVNFTIQKLDNLSKIHSDTRVD